MGRDGGHRLFMPNRSSRDINHTAFSVVSQATGQTGQTEPPKPKNPAAVALGRLGGLKGGARRAASLSPERRREIAVRAAATRWARQG